MSDNLISTIKHLELIASIKNSRRRNAILKDFAGNLKIFDALREIAVNTIKKNIPLTTHQKRKLRRYEKTILGLSRKRISRRKKKKLVEQSGGFLSIVLPIVASLVGDLIANGRRS